MANETWTGATTNNWSIPANWSETRVPQPGDVVVIPPDTAVSAPGTAVPVLNHGTLLGEHIVLQPAVFQSDLTQTAVVFNDSTLGAGSAIEGGLVYIAPDATLTVASGAVLGAGSDVQPQNYYGGTPTQADTLVNDGLIASSATGGVLLDVTNLVNDGTIIASGNEVQVDGSVTGSGTMHIRDGGMLNLAQGAGPVAFDDGTGNLQLSSVSALNSGTIYGFQAGDVIGLGVRGTVDGLSYNGGTLTLSSGGTNVAVIPLAGSYSAGQFAANLVWSHAGINVYQITTSAPPADTAPVLTLPGAEDLTAGQTMDVLGVSYSDPLGSTAAGSMHLTVAAHSGTLAATGSDGNPISGSGSVTLSLSGSYAEINRVLASLSYEASGTAGSDTIDFTVFDQGGTETSGTLPISIIAPPSRPMDNWTGAAGRDWGNAANWSNGVPGDNYRVSIPGTAPASPVLSDATVNGEVITLDGSGTASLELDNVTLGPQSVLQAASGSPAGVTLGGSLTVDSGAVLAPESGGDLALNGPAPVTVVNNGLIATPQGGAARLELNAGGTLVNHGDVASYGGGVLTLGSDARPEDVLNSGTIGMAGGGRVVLHGSVSGGTIAFGSVPGADGYGTLVLEQPMALTGGAHLVDFGLTDALELDGAAAGDALSYANGTLDVTSHGTLVQAIALDGSYTLGNFEIDVIGGATPHTIIGYAPAFGTTGRGFADVVAPDIMSVDTISVPQTGQVFNISDGVQDVPADALVTLHISAQSGTVAMPDATGSGTHSLTLTGTQVEINTDLPKLTYTAGLGAGTDTLSISATLGDSTTTRSIPVSVGNASGPALSVTPDVASGPGSSFGLPGSYLDVFASQNPGMLFLSITDQSGTLSASTASGQAAPGSGTNAITLSTTYDNVNAILNSLSYTASSNPAVTSDTVRYDVWDQAGIETQASTGISTGNGSSGGSPQLNEPGYVSVAAGGTVAVSGSYNDSFAAGNPGKLYLGITDSAGTLSATDASGNSVAGSGSSSIGLSTDYVDLNAILASLHYTADAAGTSDSISFDVWNQAGVETGWSTAVSVAAAQHAPMLADFAPGASLGSAGMNQPQTGGAGSGMVMSADTSMQPNWIPVLSGH